MQLRWLKWSFSWYLSFSFYLITFDQLNRNNYSKKAILTKTPVNKGLTEKLHF